jgi:hypothetical protein
MDPLVELLRRSRVLYAGDHSLDRFPLTLLVAAAVLIVSVSVGLWRAGRSWKLWHHPSPDRPARAPSSRLTARLVAGTK